MRKTLAVLAVIGTLMLGGCASEAPETRTEDNTVAAYVVPLPDGDSVVCVVYAVSYRGGLSCDWDAVK